MKLKFTLLAACICLSVPCWAQDREETAAETAYNQAYEQWVLGLARFLTKQESPVVRILGSWHLDTMSSQHPDLEGEGRKIRASALEDGWSNPAVVLRVYGADCARGRSEDGCNPTAVKTQFRRLDPNNAVAALLPWLFPSEMPAKKFQLSAENVATLVEAAGKETFDLYLTAGFHDAYLEFAHYELLQSQPEIPQELLAEFDERGIQPPADAHWGPSVSILSSAFSSRGGATFSSLIDFCGLAESENHTEAIRGCLDLADLMQRDPKSQLQETMGYALRKRISRPGYIGAKKELLDPERWRDQVRHLEFDCARPRMIHSANFGQMPANHWSLYIRDLQESGELVAYQRAADREYAEFPKFYEMDPADCSRIHELNEETQKVLAREHEIGQLGSVLQALDIKSETN